MDKKRIADLKEYLKQGMTYKQISLKTNINLNVLYHLKSRHLKELGYQSQGKARGKNHYLFNNYISHDGNGYITNTKTGKRIHREIMEKHLGRKLNRHEIIHHKNGNVKDNRINNLVLTTMNEHKKKYHPEIGKDTRWK